MYPSNQVFSIQLISVCCRSSHPQATGEHLQLADAETGAGERTEGGSWSSKRRGEQRRGEGEEVFVGYIIEMSVDLDWASYDCDIWTWVKGRKESTKLLYHIYRYLDSEIGIECSNWTRRMQRRHSASIMRRHQDNAHPPKQVQYWFNWSLPPFSAGVCCCMCMYVHFVSVCVRTCVQRKKIHLISNDEMV